MINKAVNCNEIKHYFHINFKKAGKIIYIVIYYKGKLRNNIIKISYSCNRFIGKSFKKPKYNIQG